MTTLPSPPLGREGDFFPFGVQYHRAPTPLPAEWDGDLRRIAEIGYTHVQFRPQWRWHERVRGTYTFDDLDRLFDLAQRHGLRVVLKPMLETAPDWAFQELDGTRIGFHGVPVSPVAIGSFYVGGWLPCFDNPGVREASSAFVAALVQRYRSHPALWFYDAWNEPRSRPLGQCHCEHSVRSYQHWLAAQYGSVERLNEEFGKAWSSLETIRPPASAGDFAEMFLWRQWAAHAVAGHVRTVVDTMHAHDPKRKVLAHAGFCAILQDPACDANDDVLTAAAADQYGTSFPVNLWPSKPAHHAEADLISDWLRRVDPNFWCHEFYPTHTAWCRPPEPQTLRRILWMAIAGGTAGFTFWQFRSERLGDESNGWGMREINGDPTPRSEVCDEIARVVKTHGPALASSRRTPARIALLYSRESDLLGRIERMAFDEPDPARATNRNDHPYKRSIHATHFAYQALGHATDFVVPGDDLAGYALVHITSAEMIDEATSDRLRSYVRSGGHLIIEYPFACRDEHTWVTPDRPHHGLADFLGCREGQRTALNAESLPVAFDSGTALDARVWRVDLVPEGGEPIARWPDGRVACIRHRLGAGEVITLGANLALSLRDEWDDPALATLGRLLHSAGITPDHDADRGLWVRRRETPNGSIWFVFNVAERKGSVTLPATPRVIWHDAESRLENGRLTLDPGAAWIAELPRN